MSGGQMGKFQNEAGLLDWSYKYVDQLDVFYACVIWFNLLTSYLHPDVYGDIIVI